MNRNKLINQLQAYQPWNEEEVEAKERMLSFIQTHPKCFDRAEPSHFTGSAWVVNHDNTKFLLTLHKKLGFWTQPGGHVEEGDADMLHVALREAKEESGLKSIACLHPEIFAIAIYTYNINGCLGFHFDVNYLLQAVDPFETIKASDESVDVHWFDKLPVHPDDCDVDIEKRMFEKWQLMRSTYRN